MDNQKRLRHLQLVQLSILKKVAFICEKNQINYFLHYGTLLGAIRHKGFIPWDDDIDVAMKRDDYEKFLQIGQSELGDDFFIQHYTTDPNYPRYIMKVRLKNTAHIESEFEDINMNHGIYIDIFPLDNVHKADGIYLIIRKQIIKKIRQLIESKKGIKIRDSKVKNSIRFLLKQILYFIPDKFLYSVVEKINKATSNSKGKYLASFNGAYNIKREVFPEALLTNKEDSYADFEDCKLRIPSDAHTILTNLYGNYMEIPPSYKRNTHDVVKLEFGKY